MPTLTAHPPDRAAPEAPAFAALAQRPAGSTVRATGVLDACKLLLTKSAGSLAYLTISDRDGFPLTVLVPSSDVLDPALLLDLARPEPDAVLAVAGELTDPSMIGAQGMEKLS